MQIIPVDGPFCNEQHAKEHLSDEINVLINAENGYWIGYIED